MEDLRAESEEHGGVEDSRSRGSRFDVVLIEIEIETMNESRTEMRERQQVSERG